MRATSNHVLVLVALLTVAGCSSDQSPGTAVRSDLTPGSSATSAEPPPVVPSDVIPSEVSTAPSGTAPVTAQAVCDGKALSLEVARAEGAGTGQSAVLIITVRNTGKTGCSLKGYPRLTALDANGKTVPFKILYGGNQSVTNQQPVTVVTRPGGTAFVTFGQYRCDVGTKAVGEQVKVLLPGVESPAVLNLKSLGGLGYCGPGDPGSEIAVSPVEPTELKTRNLHQG